MAGPNAAERATRREAEEHTPLLRGERGIQQRDDESEDTLVETQREECSNGRASSSSDVDEGRANQQVGKVRGLLIIVSLWGLIFLQASNMSGITTIQSTIAQDFDAFSETTWFSSSYLIAMSSTSPLAARLAQIFAPRNCVLVASLFFAIGGIITAQAPNLKAFLLGRVFTGLGGSGIMTISFILVLELAGKKRRGLFMGLLNTAFTTGVSFGAVIFGALLNSMGWRFLFWIQAPLAMIFGLGIFLSIPVSFTSGDKAADEGSIAAKLARIDYLGAVTLTTTICLFLFGLSSAPILWTPIMLSAVVLLAFVFIELRVASEPVIPVTVLKSRGALLSCIAQFGIMSTRWTILFYTPAYALAVRGWSPASAGSILIPTNLGFAIGGVAVGWLHIKRAGSFYIASLVSYGLFSLALLLLSRISNATVPAPLYLLSVFLNGLSTGAALNYTLAHLLHLTPPSAHFVSTALLTTFRGFAGSFGSAIGGGLFIRILKSGLETGFEQNGGLNGRKELVRKLLGSPALVKELSGVEKRVAIESYVRAFENLFLAGAGLALIMVVFQAGTGWAAGVELDAAQSGEPESGTVFENEEWEEGMERGV